MEEQEQVKPTRKHIPPGGLGQAGHDQDCRHVDKEQPGKRCLSNPLQKLCHQKSKGSFRCQGKNFGKMSLFFQLIIN